MCIGRRNVALIFAAIMVAVPADVPARPRTLFVQPVLTDETYGADQDSHYVAVDVSVMSRDILLLFIGGTGSSPRGMTLFPDLAARLGYHVISVAYPNRLSVKSSCGASADTGCFADFRQEICFGTPVNPSVSVDTLNCIHTRVVKLLRYLDTNFPGERWGQFISDRRLVWSKLIVSGHSQGAGHALYLAKVRRVDRVIMFSGANDYSNFYQAPARWINRPGRTSIARIFSFLHVRDNAVPYSEQYAVLEALGMVSNDDSTLVDGADAPWSGSHCLYTNAAPRLDFLVPRHNSTVVDAWTPLGADNQPLFVPVWRYLLTTPVSSSGMKPTAGSGSIGSIKTAGKACRVFDLRGSIVSDRTHARRRSGSRAGIRVVRIADGSGRIRLSVQQDPRNDLLPVNEGQYPSGKAVY